MNAFRKLGILTLVLVLLGLPLLAGCGGDDEEKPTVTPEATQTVEPTSQPTQPPEEKVTITIGNLTDLTGPAAVPMTTVNSAMSDVVKWANEENMIPGVKLDVLNFDGQYNPSKDLPGYLWLTENGADILFSGLPNTPVSLQPRVNADKAVLMCLSLDGPQADPPGYEFSINMSVKDITSTALNWIAEHEWDWKTNGPAKVALVSWDSTVYREQERAAVEYISAHPEQFEWKGAQLIKSGFRWETQVEATKDCDYILPPGTPIVSFIKQYYDAGGKAKLIMWDTQVAWFSLIFDSGLWHYLDDSLVFISNPWWNDDAELVNLAREILRKYHGEEAAIKMEKEDPVYINAFHQFYGLVDILKQAVEAVGAQNFSQQALYDTLTSFKTDPVEGYAPWGFAPSTDRFGYDYMLVYRADGAKG
ncbi:MAG: ABC transporter substrate-binding protein, partial [Chloroflexi bacterium]|nr:ABC transporter substrate-binding protein [Chloroflexota bacterium]